MRTQGLALIDIDLAMARLEAALGDEVRRDGTAGRATWLLLWEAHVRVKHRIDRCPKEYAATLAGPHAAILTTRGAVTVTPESVQQMIDRLELVYGRVAYDRGPATLCWQLLRCSQQYLERGRTTKEREIAALRAEREFRRAMALEVI